RRGPPSGANRRSGRGCPLDLGCAEKDRDQDAVRADKGAGKNGYSRRGSAATATGRGEGLVFFFGGASRRFGTVRFQTAGFTRLGCHQDGFGNANNRGGCGARHTAYT